MFLLLNDFYLDVCRCKNVKCLLQNKFMLGNRNIVLFFLFSSLSTFSQISKIVADPLELLSEDSSYQKYLDLSKTTISYSLPKNHTFDNNLDFTAYFNYYVNKNRNVTALLFNIKDGYANFIEASLVKKKLPLELSNLPLLLSAYNNSYVNKYGGAGIWGNNYPIAAKYGLKMDKYIDERKVDSLSNLAAINHLSELYNKYNDLCLTVLAYVSSSSLVNKAIKRSNSKEIQKVMPFIDADFRELLLAYLALNYIAENKALYNLKQLDVDFSNTIDSRSFILEKQLLFTAISDKILFDFNAFHHLNPQIRKEIIPEKYLFKLDLVSYDQLNNNLDSLFYYQDSVLLNPIKDIEYSSNAEDRVVYVVKSGDYLGKIAQYYNVSVSEIQDWNNITGSRINIGQELVIYKQNNK